MRVGIVGGGVSGLGAARTLKSAGHEAVLFEGLPEVGGRLATVRLEGFIFDSGATTIAPRKRSLEKEMFEVLSTEGLCPIEKPIYIHTSLRISSGDPAKNRIERFCYEDGNQTLALRLSEGLDVRLSSPVEAIERADSVYRIGVEVFDAIVLAIPTPQALPILAELKEHRPFANTLYRPCLSVLLGYDLPPPSVGYHAIIDPENSHPLSWLSIENLKCPARAPDGKTAIVAQMGPQFSKLYLEALDQVIVEATTDTLVRLYGKDWDAPAVSAVKRWLYSQPETTALFDSVNRPNAKVVVAGDGVLGGRLEYAYEAGVKAAQLLIGGTNAS